VGFWYPYFALTGAAGVPEHTTIMAGNGVSWTRNATGYYAADGWTLAYKLNSPTNQYLINAADIAGDGDSFTVTIPSTETEVWAPGCYEWIAVAINSGTSRRMPVATGRITILQDIFSATSPVDTRTQNEIILANIDAMIAGRSDIDEYEIAGRRVKRTDIAALLSWREVYVTRVKAERQTCGEITPPSDVAIQFGPGV